MDFAGWSDEANTELAPEFSLGRSSGPRSRPSIDQLLWEDHEAEGLPLLSLDFEEYNGGSDEEGLVAQPELGVAMECIEALYST